MITNPRFKTDNGLAPCKRFHSASSRCDSICTRSEEHTSELQSQSNLVCRLLLEKKKRVPVENGPRVFERLKGSVLLVIPDTVGVLDRDAIRLDHRYHGDSTPVYEILSKWAINIR